MHFLHHRGVKGYLTLNTLIFTNELPQAEEFVRRAALAGVDAVLVQDLGVVQLIRAICPELPIHASTQMTMTSAENIRLIESLGVQRVVLARELSTKEIRKIHKQTTMPLETFVHGALCVAYSGQCLTSESLGGRSANRGQCAQACRLPYDLICDGKDVDTADVKYLLSPQDLAAFELIPALIEAGVCSLKIEGRLKTPEYVANITRHYREAIDTAMAGRPVEFTPRQIEEMELSFSRGFSPGWLGGNDHKMLVPGKSSSKRGVLLGEVQGVRRDRIAVQLKGTVKRGDGVVFDCGRPVDDVQGGRVYEVFCQGRSLEEPVSAGVVELTFAHGSIHFDEIWPGQQVWKTDDPELTGRLRKTFNSSDPLRRVPVDLRFEAAVGSPLKLWATAASGASCYLETDEPLQLAQRHALSAQTLRDQLGRLGGTVYELRELDAKIEGQPMVPFSVLGKLRHELVRRLDESVSHLMDRHVPAEPVLSRLRKRESATNQDESVGRRKAVTPTLRVLCRSLAQLRTVLNNEIKNIYVDFQDIREYREAVTLARAVGAEIYLATPRIQKPDEMGIFHLLAKQGADGILVRNLSGLQFFTERQIPAIADFSLNVTNELTAQWIREQHARRITASYDLNRDQLLDLVAAVPAPSLEVVIHQHMPMFHMEHCVFCAVLSPGTNKTNCGRPCDVHQVQLRDRVGMEHTLTADVGCRNTLCNAVPQSCGRSCSHAAGTRRSANFVSNYSADADNELRQTIELYRQLLAGRITGREVWTKLNASNRVGVTRGTLEERRNPLAII